MSKVRNWCFTLNAKENQDLDFMHEWAIQFDAYCNSSGKLKRWVFQLEQGTNPHLQGYLSFKTPSRMSAVKTFFGEGQNHVHLAEAHGDANQNLAYCTKEATRVKGPWISPGFEPKQGKRNDLLKIKKFIDEGRSLKKIAKVESELFPTVVRSIRGLEWYEDKEIEPYTGPKFVVVFYGDAGTGKSLSAEKYANFEPYYWTQNANNWFDGYTGEQTLIMNDFSGGLPFTFFKQLLDQYPLRLNRKGKQMCPSAFKQIFITSNFAPKEWYSEQSRNVDVEAIHRRINVIAKLTWQLDMMGKKTGKVSVHFDKGGDLFYPPLPASPELIPRWQLSLLTDESYEASPRLDQSSPEPPPTHREEIFVEPQQEFFIPPSLQFGEDNLPEDYEYQDANHIHHFFIDNECGIDQDNSA